MVEYHGFDVTFLARLRKWIDCLINLEFQSITCAGFEEIKAIGDHVCKHGNKSKLICSSSSDAAALAASEVSKCAVNGI